MRKEQQGVLDTTQIEGLFFVDGDLLARSLLYLWTKGYKLAMVAFPSGLSCEIIQDVKPKIYLFGEMYLPLMGSRNSGFLYAYTIADLCGYAIKKKGESQLEIYQSVDYGYYLVTYDHERIINVNTTTSGVGRFTVSHNLRRDI